MKTNQLMTAIFYDQTLHVEHKTLMCNLTDIFSIGNFLRLKNNKSVANLAQYVKSAKTLEYIEAAAKIWGFDKEKALVVKGKGNFKGTYVHISIAIHAAEYLSPEFHALVIKEFIEGRLLQYRDESGDEFISLNQAIDMLPDRIEQNNLGLYINVAKKMKSKINPSGGKWNTATADELRYRLELERFVLCAIEHGLIKDYQTMFDTIDSYKPRF